MGSCCSLACCKLPKHVKVEDIINKNQNKHNLKLQGADPGTKDTGDIFSHVMPTMDFYYSHRFNWEKNY